jgi:hypothetical protein
MSAACEFCGGSGVHPRYSKLACPKCHPWHGQAKKTGDDPLAVVADDDDDDGDDGDQITCGTCGGSGKAADGSKCQRCGGTGKIDNPNEDDGSQDTDKEVKGAGMELEALEQWDAAVARRMRKYDEDIGTASLKVAQQNPDLYRDVCEEREACSLSSKKKRLYLESMSERLKVQGRGAQQHVFSSNLPR